MDMSYYNLIFSFQLYPTQSGQNGENFVNLELAPMTSTETDDCTFQTDYLDASYSLPNVRDSYNDQNDLIIVSKYNILL